MRSDKRFLHVKKEKTFFLFNVKKHSLITANSSRSLIIYQADNVLSGTRFISVL